MKVVMRPLLRKKDKVVIKRGEKKVVQFWPLGFLFACPRSNPYTMGLGLISYTLKMFCTNDHICKPIWAKFTLTHCIHNNEYVFIGLCKSSKKRCVVWRMKQQGKLPVINKCFIGSGLLISLGLLSQPGNCYFYNYNLLTLSRPGWFSPQTRCSILNSFHLEISHCGATRA